MLVVNIAADKVSVLSLAYLLPGINVAHHNTVFKLFGTELSTFNIKVSVSVNKQIARAHIDVLIEHVLICALAICLSKLQLSVVLMVHRSVPNTRACSIANTPHNYNFHVSTVFSLRTTCQPVSPRCCHYHHRHGDASRSALVSHVRVVSHTAASMASFPHGPLRQRSSSNSSAIWSASRRQLAADGGLRPAVPVTCTAYRAGARTGRYRYVVCHR